MTLVGQGVAGAVRGVDTGLRSSSAAAMQPLSPSRSSSSPSCSPPSATVPATTQARSTPASPPARVVASLVAAWLALLLVGRLHHSTAFITTTTAAAALHRGLGSVARSSCVVDLRSQSRLFIVKRTCVPRTHTPGSPSSQHGDSGTGNSRLRASCNRVLVAWDTPIAGGLTTGLSSEAVSFIMPLRRQVDIVLLDNFREHGSFVSGLDPRERRVLLNLKQQRQAGVHPAAPGIYLSQWPPGALFAQKMAEYGRVGSSTYRISRAMYEATRVPEDWPPNFSAIDEFWVPSQWNRRVLVEEYGLPSEDVFVVEEGLDTTSTFNPALFNHTVARQTVYPPDVQDTFIFLSVFKWEERKAPTELIRAFVEEFAPEERVSLFLRTSPQVHLPSHVQSLAGREDPRVRVLERQDDHRYQQMFVGADAFVLASHGEGWGRPIFEAMALGVPVIATNWSGPTQFLTDDTAYLLPVSSLDSANIVNGPVGAKWAHVSVTALRKLLRTVFTDRKAAARKARSARKHIATHYDQEVVAQQALARLQEACKRQAQGVFPRKRRERSHQHQGAERAVRRQRHSSQWVYEWGHRPG